MDPSPRADQSKRDACHPRQCREQGTPPHTHQVPLLPSWKRECEMSRRRGRGEKTMAMGAKAPITRIAHTHTPLFFLTLPLSAMETPHLASLLLSIASPFHALHFLLAAFSGDQNMWAEGDGNVEGVVFV